jgi:hypothetical protein
MNPQPRLWDITLFRDPQKWGWFHLRATDSTGFKMTTLANDLDSHLIRLHDLEIPAESILVMHASACDTNSNPPDAVIAVGRFSLSPDALNTRGFDIRPLIA